MSSEPIREGKIGDFVWRKSNFEDFFKPFARAGYTVSDENIDTLAQSDKFWDEDNNVLPDKITMLKREGSKTLLVGDDLGFNPEEYEKINEMLKKGEEAQAEAATLREKNADLETRLQEAKDQLHGTNAGIKGLRSQKETEETAFSILKKEIADLRKEQNEIDQYIAGQGPAVKAIETEIAGFVAEREKAKKLCRKEEDALKRFRETDIKERAELDADYNKRDQEIKEDIDEKEKALAGLAANLGTAQEEFAEVSQKLDAKKAALTTVETELDNVKKTRTYQALQKKFNKRDLLLRQIIRTVIPLDSGKELDSMIVKKLFEQLSAVKTLYAKLDEVAAEVLEKDTESQPKATDSAFSWFTSKAKSAKDTAVTIFKKKPAKPKDVLEVTKYISVLDKIRDAVVAYKNELEQAVKAPEPGSVIDEKIEGLLNDLLGAVDAKPADEEIANPGYIRNYVAGVRECGFEIYSLIASRDAEAITYVLDDLAQTKYEEGDSKAAVEITERAVDLCKKALPDDKERLADFEANLQIYRGNSE